jgi:antitoxin CcdA
MRMARPRHTSASEARKRFAHLRRPGQVKKPVNVLLDAELLNDARRLKINLSQTLEGELRRLTEDERIVRWQHEHRGFFESYNVYVERNGVFGEELLDLDDSSV